ncbi:hypothetical protein [uncultured Tenacibaculum sp.]|uniref:hypothetical protein n=1 Tax=uncultured Tenacibaculum sp. TaxID=174713 RepID=UPI0026145130|nr:hypothetical protein [uncultured Tenacibaculum sp.]
MDTYTVGDNKPIKLKIEIDTESIPFTYSYIRKTNTDSGFKSDITPFNPSEKKGWKTINKGGAIKNILMSIHTDCRFVNYIANEETFNLAVQRIKNSYKVIFMGGDTSNFEVSFSIDSNYDKRICWLVTKVKFD